MKKNSKSFEDALIDLFKKYKVEYASEAFVVRINDKDCRVNLSVEEQNWRNDKPRFETLKELFEYMKSKEGEWISSDNPCNIPRLIGFVRELPNGGGDYATVSLETARHTGNLPNYLRKLIKTAVGRQEIAERFSNVKGNENDRNG